ncbi:hypothetical protein Tsubulata_018676 [Turnera subulata]|uniref:Cystinosin homolog n=1 Tax=Turnera subulata TaxID=218843 RepID=A0A9Q0F787_9ROSI|nr:hypothetical protein Tsubulata_018676 [Turnera subulata]
MASWNSIPLEITYEAFGWIAFISWSISFYPQVILNFRRKSVVGLNFDFVVLNLTKHSSYLIYNASLYFSPAIQEQYYQKYGYGEMIPVAANDVAFSIHAVLLTAFTLFQIVIYERGNQKVSKISIGILSIVWLIAAVCFFVALPSHSWLWLISVFNSIQVFMTLIKYIPQVRVSTLFYPPICYMLPCLVSVFFDLLFMCQHYILYPAKKTGSAKLGKEHLEPAEPLIAPSDDTPQSDNV